jgi:hypothetical protein
MPRNWSFTLVLKTGNPKCSKKTCCFVRLGPLERLSNMSEAYEAGKGVHPNPPSFRHYAPFMPQLWPQLRSLVLATEDLLSIISRASEFVLIGKVSAYRRCNVNAY